MEPHRRRRAGEAHGDPRRAHAARYRELLAGGPVALPVEAPDRRHVYHVFTIRHPERDRLAAELAAHGVATGIHYPVPVHLQPAYADLGYRRGDFPVAERAAAEVLSLPMYPELRPDQVEAIAELVTSLASGQPALGGVGPT